MTIFSPGDCWGGDPKHITAQSERLLQGDSEVQWLAVILDLWRNWRSEKEKGKICVYTLFQSSLRCFVRRKNNKPNWILTVYFQPGLSLHRACFIGCHTLEVPAVAGRRCADYESSIPRHRKLWLFRVYLQAILEPAYSGMRWTCRCGDKKSIECRKWALLITPDRKKSYFYLSASLQENWMGKQPRLEKASSTFIGQTAGQQGRPCQNG